MADIFLKIVNMSISASWIVLVVLLLRLLFKKAPKWITVLLWGIVAIRLICPFSLESVMSLIPSTETISPGIMMDNTPTINSGVPIINNIVNPVIGESFTPDPGASANPLQILIPVLAIAWILGIIIMLAYTVISYFRIKRKIGTAVLLRDNIYQSENVVSPFVLGIIKPKIYLPFNMNEQDTNHVIAHENAHISRKDHLWKPFGFLILTLHWFNPLMWVSYILLCRDIELACDEKVVKEFDKEQKADYSQALLTCSINRRMIAACPLAFGEIGVKNRVKSILNYKKPAFLVIAVAIIAIGIFAVCFLTNPVSAEPNKNVIDLDVTTELSDEQTPTGEKTPEDNKEPEKVKKTPEQSDPAVTPPTDKEENKKEEVKEPEKIEKTPEFYDFMALDPEPEWTIKNYNDWSNISSKFYTNRKEYEKTGKMNFTKKENYYFNISDEAMLMNYRIRIYFKKDKTDFYSSKTMEKLINLGCKAKISENNNSQFCIMKLEHSMQMPTEEIIDHRKEAIKIALEDHNVAYVYMLSSPGRD